MPVAVSPVDPFDLPEWLGTADVVWVSQEGLRSGHHVRGTLTGTGETGIDCDLLAVDLAYPLPVAGEDLRQQAHHAWQHGEVLVGVSAGRLTLAAPGSRWAPDQAIEALARFARAVGARPERYALHLRIGG